MATTAYNTSYAISSSTSTNDTTITIEMKLNTQRNACVTFVKTHSDTRGPSSYNNVHFNKIR